MLYKCLSLVGVHDVQKASFTFTHVHPKPDNPKIELLLYGRLYAQLDRPQKVRFEINAVEVYGLL